jgi:[ribosomal protein S18]-alanine N-acetyltransferase
MLIRAAVPEDIPQIMALAQRSDTAAHWSAREYDALFAPDTPRRIALVAAHSQDKIAGFLVARCAPAEWEIENVVVEVVLRRQGIAQSLIEELLQEARHRGVAAILLEVRESNAAARALYRKMGFHEEGRRPRYYARPEEDALLLRLLLKS